MSLTIPNTIANGNSADGNEVGANFEAIETWAADVITKDGSVAMTGALTLPGSPSSNLQAATKQYVDTQVSSAASTASGALTAGLAGKCPVAKFTRTTDIALSSGAGSDVNFEAETNDQDAWWSSGNTVSLPAGLYAIGCAVLSDGAGQLKVYLTVALTKIETVTQSGVGQNSTIHAGGVYYFPTATSVSVVVEEQGSGAKTVRQVDLAICQLAEV